MNGTKWLRLGLSAFAQFIITGGTALTVAGASTQDGLSQTTWILSAIGGLVAAAKDLQAQLAAPPQ